MIFRALVQYLPFVVRSGSDLEDSKKCRLVSASGGGDGHEIDKSKIGRAGIFWSILIAANAFLTRK